MENEVFPIVGGLIAGLVLGTVTARQRRWWFGLGIAVALGFLATVVSGEFRATWAYLLIDIPLVAAASAVGGTVSRRVRRRQLALS
jgi:hypothetical protein